MTDHISLSSQPAPDYYPPVPQGTAIAALRDIMGNPISPDEAMASDARSFVAQKIQRGPKLDFSRPPKDSSPYWVIEIADVKGSTSPDYTRFASGAIFYDEAADEYATANVWAPLAFVPQRWFSGSFYEKNHALIAMQRAQELRLHPPGMPLPPHVVTQVVKNLRDQAARFVDGSKGQKAVLNEADYFEAMLTL
jgi:hypothetical protein